jgi:hypothetical protein
VNRNKPRKAELSVQYVVRTKDQVDPMKVAFANFQKRCTIFDRAPKRPDSNNEVPVILSEGSTPKCLSINLDPACEVAVHELEDVVSIVHSIGDMLITLKGGEQFKVRVGVMGPEDE